MDSLIVIFALGVLYFIACKNKYEWGIRSVLNKTSPK